MPQNYNSQRIKSLKRSLSLEMGIPEYFDHYFFLSRMGSNWDYRFNWEPFRDLAGPLIVSENSVPIIAISSDNSLTHPDIRFLESPEPHYQLWLSPSIDVSIIADKWLSLLVKAHASHGSYKGPFDWFFEFLEINPDQLSETSRRFLFV